MELNTSQKKLLQEVVLNEIERLKGLLGRVHSNKKDAIVYDKKIAEDIVDLTDILNQIG